MRGPGCLNHRAHGCKSCWKRQRPDLGIATQKQVAALPESARGAANLQNTEAIPHVTPLCRTRLPSLKTVNHTASDFKPRHILFELQLTIRGKSNLCEDKGLWEKEEQIFVNFLLHVFPFYFHFPNHFRNTRKDVHLPPTWWP